MSQKAAAFVDDAIVRGARVTTGGDWAQGPFWGNFFPPTVIRSTPHTKPQLLESHRTQNHTCSVYTVHHNAPARGRGRSRHTKPRLFGSLHTPKRDCSQTARLFVSGGAVGGYWAQGPFWGNFFPPTVIRSVIRPAHQTTPVRFNPHTKSRSFRSATIPVHPKPRSFTSATTTPHTKTRLFVGPFWGNFFPPTVIRST